MTYRILVVDDDHKTVDLIRLALEKEHFEAFEASEGLEALSVARSASPDLIILDWMLPTVSGLDLCRILRAESAVPVIMLTAKANEEDKLLGLKLGVDDYLTKPFSLRELVARVRVILRRVYQSDERPAPLRIGGLVVDMHAHEVWLNGQAVHLTPKEFKLLETFARAPGRTFTRQELVERLYEPEHEGLDRTIDFHVANLRKKIEATNERSPTVQTVFGIGYKLRSGNDAS